MSRRSWVFPLSVIMPLVSANMPAIAQVACGDMPKDLPLVTQEQLKGDTEGKAQLLTRLLGGAQIKGTIDNSRAELHEEHKNVDQHQIDMYFLWVSCQTISADRTLSTADKVRLLLEVYAASAPHPEPPLAPASAPPPAVPPPTPAVPPTPHAARNPNTLYQYGEAIADVQGAVISQADGVVTFQSARSNGKADTKREIEYQDWGLACPDLPRPPPNVIVGQFVGLVVGMRCTITRKLP